MRTLTLLLALGTVILLAAFASAAPPPSAIEAAFSLHPEAIYTLNTMAGEHYHVQYKRIEARKNGEYAIIVKWEQ
jgi:hypothetical protein